MAQYFNESTDEGKLYINYPMLESCKHFRRMPDLAFLTREVELADIPRYKELVGREACYQSYERDFNKTLLDLIVLLHIAKACHLCGLTFDPCACRTSYARIDLENLLQCQNERYRSQAPIPVLATCLFFICDYSFGLIDHETATRALWEMG